MNQEEHFILSKTISGIQEQVKRFERPQGVYISAAVVEEFQGYLQGLRDVVNELAMEE
jgi:hypothetical protein